MNHLAGKYCNLFIMLFVLLSTGCARQLPFDQQMADLPTGPICRVAVLPFLNESDFPLADVIFSKVFAAQLQSASNYLLIQEGDILQAYRQLHILPMRKPSGEQFQIIASRVSAQLLITGTVLDMRENPAEHSTVNPLLIVDIQIIDGRSGEVLWTTFHQRHGSEYKKIMHIGTIHTVTGLSRQVADEIINIWFKKGLNQCNVLPQS